VLALLTFDILLRRVGAHDRACLHDDGAHDRASGEHDRATALWIFLLFLGSLSLL